MKLDRNLNANGRGKYALVKLRELANEDKFNDEVYQAINMLIGLGIIDLGNTTATEFFVIRLKDKYAFPALAAYALAASKDDPEWALEVLELSRKSLRHPLQKQPD